MNEVRPMSKKLPNKQAEYWKTRYKREVDRHERTVAAYDRHLDSREHAFKFEHEGRKKYQEKFNEMQQAFGVLFDATEKGKIVKLLSELCKYREKEVRKESQEFGVLFG